MEDTKYRYFLSIKNICESCGFDHEKAETRPIIMMDKEAYGAWCNNCGVNMHPTLIKPSMKEFTKKELED